MRNLFLALSAWLLLSPIAHATTYTFDLFDHPDGNMQNTYDYGLRLDRENPSLFWSFTNATANSGTGSTLVYNAATGTATISGSMEQSFSGNVSGPIWTVFYEMTDVINLGGGGFKVRNDSGAGWITDGTTTLLLGAAANNAGDYFIFDTDGHRLGGHPSYDPDTTFSGRGWVQKNPGANDFLFTGELVSTMPLPSSALLVLGGFGGLFAMKRRKKAG